MINKFVYNFLIILIIFSSISCSKTEKKVVENKKTFPLETLYRQAYESFEIGNYTRAIELFERVEKDYSYTEWAPKALLMRAYIYYDTNDYIKALTYLQRFKKYNSGHKNIAYAEYLIAICLFEQINLPALTQENTKLALEQFNKIIKNYPKSTYAEDAKFKIDLIYEQLAAKEMYLARYYAKRKKWAPALYRLDNIVKNYQNTIFIEEALHRLVEIHYLLGNINAAKKYAAILGYNYNDSDWYKKSYNLVENKNIPLSHEQKKRSMKDKFKELIGLQ